MHRRHVFTLTIIACSVSLIASTGCSYVPAPPDWPGLSPGRAAGEAIDLYDKNDDGKLDAEELEASLPLSDSLSRVDSDGDGMLSEAEIQSRIAAWFDGIFVITSQGTMVWLDDEPLVGATVTYEPEPFLAHGIETTSAVTDESGFALPPGQDPKFPGLYVGWYRVRISKKENGQEIVPARYNTETTLVKEICGLPDRRGTVLHYYLKSR